MDERIERRGASYRAGVLTAAWADHQSSVTRRIGISGGLFISAPLRETAGPCRRPDIEAVHWVQARHGGRGWRLGPARLPLAGSLGIGLMSGGYGREELERAGVLSASTTKLD